MGVSLLGSFFAVLLVLWIEKMRLPNLEIITGEEAHDDITYPPLHPHAGERWKFFRCIVRNKPFPFPFAWINRQAAQVCNAKIEFFKPGESRSIFDMLGRWASTPEVAYFPDDEKILRMRYPDPITIPANATEELDVIAKNENEKCGYGWNNDAYFPAWRWRTPHYKLDPGSYTVRIQIFPQNGRTFRQEFRLQIGERIEDTLLQTSK